MPDRKNVSARDERVLPPTMDPKGAETSSGDKSSKAHSGTVGGGRPSLYEDTIKDRRTPRYMGLVWIVLAACVLGALLTVFLGSPQPSSLDQVKRVAPQKAEDSSLTEKLLAEIRSQQDQEVGNNQGSAAGANPSPTGGDSEAGSSPRSNVTADRRQETSTRTTELAEPDGPASPGDMKAAVPAAAMRSRPERSRTGVGEAIASTRLSADAAGETRDPGLPSVSPPKVPNESPVNETPPAAAATGTSGFAADDRRQAVEQPRHTRETESPTTSQPPPKLARALELLTQHSSVAYELVTGKIATLRVEDQRIVHETPEEVWVDLIARWTTSGTEVHLIWAVNLTQGSVRPLSFEAKQLEQNDLNS